MNRHGLWRIMCMLLVLVPALALFAGPVLANSGFTDVTEEHWAYRDITKMSALGIVGGYGDGTFRPGDDVSQVEAVLMAVRCLDDETGSRSAEVPFTVPGWAEQDVARAVSLGLLRADEAFYAKSPAPRAWVARLLVRLIGKEAEARSAGTPASFADSAAIPDWAAGYVKTAVDYGLVGGYSDNTFRPNQAVSRAELAALLGRALQYMDPPEGAVTGRVLEIDTGRIKVDTPAGEKIFYLPGNLPAFDESGKISPTELQRYDRVLLAADGQEVRYLEKLPGEPVSEVVSGTLEKVYPEMGAVVLETALGEIRTFYLPEGADVTGGSLNQLQPGDGVEVALDEEGYISSIVVKSRGGGAANEGVVYDLDLEAYLITLEDDAGKLHSYRLAENTVVVAEGYRFPTVEDVREGDRVRLEVEAGYVREIEVLEVSSRLSVTGTVITVSPDKGIMTLECEDELKAFRVATGVDVEISGLESAVLGDVETGDEIEARVENGQITYLKVLGREAAGRRTGTVVAVDTAHDVITLRDADDNLLAYELNDDCRVVIDGEEARLSDIKKDAEVNLRLLDDQVIYLEVDNSIKGTVVDVDEKGLLLVLRDEVGNKKTYVLDKDVDVDCEDGRNEVDEIKNGDFVEVELDGDLVTEIKLRSAKVLRVDRVREEWDRIYTEDEDGDAVRLYMEDDVDLVVPGVDYPDLDDVEEGDLVRATYLGHDLDKVEVLQPKRGRVTAINTASDTVSVEYYDGEKESLVFDTNSEVVISDEEYDNLGMLGRGDRVEVIENVEGGLTFKVMEEITGVLAFPVEDDEVYLDDGQMGWDDYDLAKDVVVRGGNISLRDLLKGDRVKLYLLDDLVYEIELL